MKYIHSCVDTTPTQVIAEQAPTSQLIHRERVRRVHLSQHVPGDGGGVVGLEDLHGREPPRKVRGEANAAVVFDGCL